MTIKVYVNWDIGEIINEKEYNAYLDKQTKKVCVDSYNFESFLRSYIEGEEFPYAKLFTLSECEREELLLYWEKQTEDHVKLCSPYDEVEIEI